MVDKRKLSSSDKIMCVFLIIVVAIIPLISKLSIVPLSQDEVNVIRDGTVYQDIFSYSKSILIITMGIIMTVYIAFQIFTEDGFVIEFKSLPVILAGVYVLLAFLSSIFSKYRATAFRGVSERYEGFWIWLFYIIFMVISLAFAKDITRVRYAILPFILSSFLVGLIGFLQYLGFNLFATELGSKMVLGSSYNGNKLSIVFDSVFATLYNPNCAGMYFAMMFSLVVVIAVLMPIKSKLKWLLCALSAMLFIVSIGTNSVGGFIGIIVAIFFVAIVMMIKNIFILKNKRAIIISLASIVIFIVTLVIMFLTNSVIIQKLRVINDSFKNTQSLSVSESFYEDVNIDGMKGEVYTKGGVFAVDYAEQASQFMHNGTVLDPVESKEMSIEGGKEYLFEYNDISWKMYLYNNNATIVGIDKLGKETYFMFGEVDGKLSLLDKFSNAVDINEEVESFGFKGMERLGSNRGYIYSRSIPLIKENLILGSGCDTFVFEFPQEDIRSKLQFLGNPYVIIDKPHNIYIQSAINTGLLSLVVMLIMFIYYIIQTVSVVIKDTHSKTKGVNIIRLGLLAGCIAYMVAGLTTDSVVSVAPVFWTMLGVGFGANLIKVDNQ